MARKEMIPDDVRERVIAVVDQFNEENVKPPELSPVHKILKWFGAPSRVEIGHRYGDYVVRFRGAFLYLDRIGINQRPSEICLSWQLNLSIRNLSGFKANISQDHSANPEIY